MEMYSMTSLLPQLMTFNGTNPNSTFILDNCSIQYLQDIVHLIHSVGALVIFLPPYSPDLMPIEECFNKVKLFVKEHEAVAQSNDIEKLIRATFAFIISEDCIAWCIDCRYIENPCSLCDY